MRVAEQDSPGTVQWLYVGMVVLALIAGLVVGFWSISRASGAGGQGPGVSQERYAVLASTLYAEGEPIAMVQRYLAALDVNDREGFLTQLADRYGKSGDRTKQRQAEDLRQLGQALRQAGAGIEVPTVIPAVRPAGAEPAAATPSAAPPAPPAAAMAVTKADGVRLRTEASTKGATVALLKGGTKVEILDVVEGEMVEQNEKRWYKVRSGQTVGFVYFTLLTPGE